MADNEYKEFDELKALRREIAAEFRELREEVAKLRKELAERYGPPQPASAIDWRQPFMVGTPQHKLVPMEALPPGTIVCGAGACHG